MIENARMVVLKTNDSSDCQSTRRRIGRVVTATSEVCAVTAIVNAKYRKSVWSGSDRAVAPGKSRLKLTLALGSWPYAARQNVNAVRRGSPQNFLKPITKIMPEVVGTDGRLMLLPRYAVNR